MSNLSISNRSLSFLATLGFALAMLAGVNCASAAGEKEILFNGKDLGGWKLRNPQFTQTWKVVSEVKLDADNPKLLVGSGQGGSPEAAMFRGPIDHGSDIMTEKEFGDCQLHVEFMVPKGSNSGVYLMGRYEVQVLDSFGRPDNQLGMGDCGAIYSARVPSINASKAPGQWQSFDITFRAPRFDAAGKKTENARFLSVVFNGKTIHENVEVKGGTGGEIGPEQPTGPILLQGDHGIVAYRNIWVTPLESK
jgi:hypothetical protein